MKTTILLIVCSAFTLNTTAQENPSNQQNPKEQNQYQQPQNQPSQTPQNTMDTAKNCLTLKNGKVMVVQHGKSTPLIQDTTLVNGTKITTNGNIITRDGDKMVMKTGECFSMEGIRMSNAPLSPGVGKAPLKSEPK